MDETSVRPMPRLPMPRGAGTEVWVIDMTRPELVSRTWTPKTAPYRYTASGVWVRKAMPAKGLMLAHRLLARLSDYAERMVGDLHREFRVSTDEPSSRVAELVLATALVENGTPFATVQVEPSGRVWFTHRMHRTPSWHPDVPRECAR